MNTNELLITQATAYTSDETWEWKLVSRGQLLPTRAEAMESLYYTTQRGVIILTGRV
jgi:hypothetical protein